MTASPAVTLFGYDPVSLTRLEFVLSADQAAEFERTGRLPSGYGAETVLLVDEDGGEVQRHLLYRLEAESYSPE